MKTVFFYGLSCRRAGFTLTEMIVAVSILAIVLTVSAFTIGDVQRTVTDGVAGLDTLPATFALRDQIQSDLDRLSRDHFLVIRWEDRLYDANNDGIAEDINNDGKIDAGDTFPADQLCFIANGQFFSQQYDPSTQTNQVFPTGVARIWWGHLINAHIWDPSDFNYLTQSQSDFSEQGDVRWSPNRWMLGRTQFHYTRQPEGGLPSQRPLGIAAISGGNPDNFFFSLPNGVPPFTQINPNAVLMTEDIVLNSISDIRSNLTGQTTNQLIRDRTRRMNFRHFGRIRPEPSLNYSELRENLIQAGNVVSPYVSGFKVEYWDPNGVEAVTDALGNIITPASNNGGTGAWQREARNNAGASIPFPDNTFMVGYGLGGWDVAEINGDGSVNGGGKFPPALRITVWLHDSRGTLAQRFLDGTRDEYGEKVEFIVNLPR